MHVGGVVAAALVCPCQLTTTTKYQYPHVDIDIAPTTRLSLLHHFFSPFQLIIFRTQQQQQQQHIPNNTNILKYKR